MKQEIMYPKQKIPEMLTIKETAERFGMSQYSIRKLIQQRKIAFIHPTSKYLINADRFSEYLNSMEEE